MDPVRDQGVNKNTDRKSTTDAQARPISNGMNDLKIIRKNIPTPPVQGVKEFKKVSVRRKFPIYFVPSVVLIGVLAGLFFWLNPFSKESETMQEVLTEVGKHVVLPKGYPDTQIDMAYFLPSLSRMDGKTIRQLSTATFDGNNWQQWSRHRTSASTWRIGEDNLSTHMGLVADWLDQELRK